MTGQSFVIFVFGELCDFSVTASKRWSRRRSLREIFAPAI
jgi:hypothetical protein